jgi:PAS domain S-box-containing protein/diguanylate cyclase (GGDEF)-like protein
MDAEADRRSSRTPPHQPHGSLALAAALVGAATWHDLRIAAEPAIRDLLGATRVTLALTDAYLAPHLDLTTEPPLGPLLRVPLEAGGRTHGVLEVTASDAATLTAARPAAAHVAALVATRLTELWARGGRRPEPRTLAAALDGLPTPVAVTATSDGAQVWRNRAYRSAAPPPHRGPEVVVAVGDLAVAAWGEDDDVRRTLEHSLSAHPDAVAILRPVHDHGDGLVTDFHVAWSNHPHPELGGAPLRTSVRAATRRIGSVDLFAELVGVLRTQTPTALEGVDVVPAGAASPFTAALDITLAPLGDAVVCAWHATRDPARAHRSLEDREQLFRTALDATLDPVMIVVPIPGDDGATEDAADFELVWCNRAHLGADGPRPGSSLHAIARTMPGVDVVDAHRRVLETGEPMVLDDVRVESTDAAGAAVHEFVDVGIARFGAGLLTSYRPATERVRAERELRGSERLFRGVFDEAPRGMILFSLDEACLGRCLRVNPAYQELTGYNEQVFLDGSWHLVVPPDEVDRTRALFAEMAAGRVHRRHVEGHLRTASGTIVDVAADFSVVTRAGRPGWCVVHVEDITERRRAESEVSWLAMHDPLTGLPNRHLFVHHVRHALGRLERRPGSVAVLSVVVDDDREAEDADGRLVDVARRLAEAVRRSDTPARLGGGDFAVLLPEIGGVEGARRLARRVVDALGDDQAGEIGFAARVGLAVTGDSDADAAHLVRSARLDAAPTLRTAPAAR